MHPNTYGRIKILKVYAYNCGHKDVENNIAAQIGKYHCIYEEYAMDGNISFSRPFSFIPERSNTKQDYQQNKRVI